MEKEIDSEYGYLLFGEIWWSRICTEAVMVWLAQQSREVYGGDIGDWQCTAVSMKVCFFNVWYAKIMVSEQRSGG